ncbi:hypothetical protein NDU88_006506 [Pleurodeles waltl]|uniref:Uncharacterized protein n=1 Tax=Pleurodeles waltl TaxID=8319 RepID=A0AAV7PIJ7_PLEWA|nr:hypothetical protein NDU88_006506 [Pleurodeles waltl]
MLPLTLGWAWQAVTSVEMRRLGFEVMQVLSGMSTAPPGMRAKPLCQSLAPAGYVKLACTSRRALSRAEFFAFANFIFRDVMARNRFEVWKNKN